MSLELRKQIREALELKPTDELLEIWKTNDRVEWSEEAFEAVREILKRRRVKAGRQGPAIHEHPTEEEKDAEFTELELKIIDDENPPDFYDPMAVLQTSRWLEIAAKVMIGLAIAANLVSIRSSYNIAQSYLYRYPNAPVVYLVTFLLFVLNTAIGVVVAYFPLVALARILKILMEMEFNSRKRR